MEEDLRELLSTNLSGGRDARDILGEDVYARASERFAFELGDDTAEADLVGLLRFTDFGDLTPIINANRKFLPEDVSAYIRDITPQLEKLTPVRRRVAHSRPLNVDDLPITMDTAERLVSAAVGPWRNLRETLDRVKADPSYVLGIRIPTPQRDDAAAKHNLPTPDFDETGFIGREEERRLIVQACYGPFPVISVLGEGGVGKTAVALKAAYEILDDPRTPFDAIVWVTCKSEVLTTTEIRRIENAIADSLGMFRALASELGGASDGDPVEEVLAYLKEFRILLLIDNLETVMDDRIREFLERMPAGSKVLITSRVGLGAYDRPIKLPPMSEGEAVILLRTLALVRQVRFLVQMSTKDLARYCNRLKRNPGFIKWFVAGVQTGRRPEELLANPSLFLDFCLSNIYEYLGDNARTVLRSLLCVPGKLSQAELAFLSGLSEQELQTGLNALLTTNMATLSSIPLGNTYESLYELNELARAYLSRHYPLSPQESRRIAGRRAEIVAAAEQLSHLAAARPYLISTIALRTNRDVIVAKFLTEALEASKKGRFGEAEQLLATAKGLAPDFYEVYRVSGVVKAFAGDFTGAHQAYETALDLAPNSAPLRMFYAGFLMRHADDAASASKQLEIAAKLDPSSIEITTELARALLYTFKFDDALRVINAAGAMPSLSERSQRVLADLKLQCYTRRADVSFRSREYAAALDSLEAARATYEEIPGNLLDGLMVDKLRKVLSIARATATHFKRYGLDLLVTERAESITEWIAEKLQRPYIASGRLRVGTELRGRISDLPAREDFGFVELDSGAKIFFHRSSLETGADWNRLSIGSLVSFTISDPDVKGRYRGLNIRILELADPDLIRPGTVLRGMIITLTRERGFGFVRAQQGPRYFFHSSSVVGAGDWGQMRVGDRVQFIVTATEDGRLVATGVQRVSTIAARGSKGN